MPFSSGGGDFSGGSSGGSGGHGSGDDVFLTEFGENRSHLKRRYVAYKRGIRTTFYSKTNPVLSRQISKVGIISCIIIIAILAFLMLLSELSTEKTKLYSSAEFELKTIDSGGMLGDTSELEPILKNFYEQTGIMPAILTVPNSEVTASTLKKYAYTCYLKVFDNETSWLIVVKYDGNHPNDMTCWAWEGMQGNDTGKILTGQPLETFNATIQSGLYSASFGEVSGIFASAFRTLNRTVMSRDNTTAKTILLALIIVCCVVMLVFIIRYVDSKIVYGESVMYYEKDTQKTTQKCRMCGKTVRLNRYGTCPKCGTPLNSNVPRA